MNYLPAGSIERKNIEIGLQFAKWRRQDKLIKAIGTVVVRSLVLFVVAVMAYGTILLAQGKI